MKVVHRDKFTNIVLKEEGLLNTPAEQILKTFGDVFAGCCFLGNEEGFKILRGGLAEIAKKSIEMIQKERPDWEKE